MGSISMLFHQVLLAFQLLTGFTEPIMQICLILVCVKYLRSK